MNALPFTPNEVLSWYFDPEVTKKADAPDLPFDAPLEDLQESINLTLHYLMATGIDASKTRPNLAQDPEGAATLVWRLFFFTQVNKQHSSEGTKTERRALHYGFDLAGNLVLETYISDSYESPLRQTWSWPDPSELSTELKKRLLIELMNIRDEIHHMLPTKKPKKRS